MHFEVLTEDSSGSVVVEAILEKIFPDSLSIHTWEVYAYRGLGRIPKNLKGQTDPTRRILLDRLPDILEGYGRSLQHWEAAVIVVVDLDHRDCLAFKQELTSLLDKCIPAPSAIVRIAIEEIEAWLLGDRKAVTTAYPLAKTRILNSYVQDGIVGTWEVLADAVHPGGARSLKEKGYPEIGRAKRKWAEEIAPHMDIYQNRSKSFQVFRDGVRRLAGCDE